MEYFELRELSERLEIPIERIRYIVNQDLVPFRDWLVAEDEPGQPHRYDLVDSLFIACATYLLDAGQKRDSVKEIMKMMGKIMPDARNPLHVPLMGWAVTSKEKATVQIADGLRIRWRHGSTDTGWVEVGPPRRRDDDFEPRVIVALDFGLIRDMVRGTKS